MKNEENRSCCCFCCCSFHIFSIHIIYSQIDRQIDSRLRCCGEKKKPTRLLAAICGSAFNVCCSLLSFLASDDDDDNDYDYEVEGGSCQLLSYTLTIRSEQQTGNTNTIVGNRLRMKNWQCFYNSTHPFQYILSVYTFRIVYTKLYNNNILLPLYS